MVGSRELLKHKIFIVEDMFGKPCVLGNEAFQPKQNQQPPMGESNISCQQHFLDIQYKTCQGNLRSTIILELVK